ncbi:MAG: prolyl oligopeptidase family serine peptidase [Bacteroidaceae bacterium]|nr:prolyl oligopeptidase family serine peptidase [Bacteroidaceae bacterium]MBR1800785.1 prolyl oligopeptidase family serine peptidase [Bacteroidaceae bacterium]
MKMKKYFLFLIYHFLFIIPIVAQGTLDDYNRAYFLQRTFTWAKVKNHVDDARWLPDGRFQYHLTDGAKGTWHFGQVNADGTITLADSTADRPIEESRHDRRPRWGSARGGATNAHFIANPSKRRQERHWMETDDERSGDPVLSPDSSLIAFIRNDNVYVAKPDGSNARALSTEGTISHYFSSYIYWSPDSRYIAVNRIRPIDKRYVYYVESSPADQLQPVLHKQEYAKPGDELAQKTPYIFEVATGRAVCPTPEAIANQYDLSGPTWCRDSHAIRFEYNQRGHKLYRVYEMTVPTSALGNFVAETVSPRPLIEERAEKYVRYSNNFRRDLYGDSLILWLSERDGFPHLYLFDTGLSAKSTPKPAKSGSPSSKARVRSGFPAASPECPARQLTNGSWCVRRVLHVDEEKGFIIFTANGRHSAQGDASKNKDEDPYHIHYYRVNLDGTGLTDLTPEPAHHNARFNDDYTALIDTYSTVDTPPITKVRALGDSIAEKPLSTSDITDLLSAGWTAPEVFVAPGRDGVTPMWGIIQRPTHFDPAKKYPIIEYIYAGPGDSYVPKSFQPYNYYTTALADLGFIVVQLDAMGTSNRGKKFEEVCYKNLKDAGFPDRIAWIKAAAAKYPYMDIDRVGIYGCSAGGQESTGAVLFHGDFYKAAYSACGCHDNRMDKIWWNEQWMGYPVDSSYIECSNVENAYRLERPLMLVVGELDDNVDPASTMQVAAALIKANKPFELVVIPGAHHTVGEAYGEHKRFDFFVKNLLGVDPPAWSEVKTK